MRAIKANLQRGEFYFDSTTRVCRQEEYEDWQSCNKGAKLNKQEAMEDGQTHELCRQPS